jgi:hypothetical protein
MNMRKTVKGILQAGILLVAFGTSLMSQESRWAFISKDEMAKELEKMNSAYKNTPCFSVKVTHTTFKNYTTTVPYDKSSGYFKKDGSNYHSYLMGIHTIQNKRYRIVIDSSKNLLMVANPSGDSSISVTTGDYLATLKICSSQKSYEINKEKHLRLDFKNYTYTTIEITLNDQGFLKEIVFYRSQESPGNGVVPNSPSSAPRMSVSFSDYRFGVSFSYKDEFDENRYFGRMDKKLVVREQYKNFKFLDERYLN